MLQILNEKLKSAGPDQGSEVQVQNLLNLGKMKHHESTVQNPQPQVINHQQVHPQM